MNTSVYNKIVENSRNKKKMIAVLIDPDKYVGEKLLKCISQLNEVKPDFILTGGSLTTEPTEQTIQIIKENSDLPVVLFPGNANQFSNKTDALFLLSLISGRNPEYLIGQHVTAAAAIYRSGIETIPVAYILVESGCMTSVEYISNTKPIPSDKTDVAVATALAGEQTGNKLIYLEAGSGARNMVPAEMIREVKKYITMPLIVGGGIKTTSDVITTLSAGADMIVVGNVLEKDPGMMQQLVETTHNF